MRLTNEGESRLRDRVRTGTVSLVVAGLALAGCAGGSPDAEREPDPSPAAEAFEDTGQGEQTEREQVPGEHEEAPGEHEEAAGEHEQADRNAEAQADEGPSMGEPVEVVIPAIGVHERVIGLGLNDDGSMEVPDGDEVDLPGWYELGPRPGENGNAVIAGHVDNDQGPSIFFSLSHLEPGDEVAVRDDDGQVVTFEVDRVEMYPRDALPVQDIFGFGSEPKLQLITCGGQYDEHESTYTENVVVFADLVEGPD